MRKITAFSIAILVIIFFSWLISQNFARFAQYQKISPEKDANTSDSSLKTIKYQIEPVAGNLEVPWGMVFTSQDRIIVTQRPGLVSEVIEGKVNPTPLRQFDEISNQSEDGLMGITLDPNYLKNHYLYLCLTYKDNDQTYDKVIRVIDNQISLDDDKIVIDKIPAANFHAGCRVKFGPDGKLYISTGEATDKKIAQDLNSLGGKILRLNADGTIPDDNPFLNSPVWSFGHRNPQGFDWQPITNALIATEHGPSGFDGPGGGDEVNYIQKGKNYGWPEVSHDQSQEGMESPLLVFTPSVAPASGMFYRSDTLPELTNSYLFGLLKGEGIMQVVFDQQKPEIIYYQKLENIDVGRVRDVVEGPDGYIYFTSSNRDGRGKAKDDDDHIYRLVPIK